MRKPFWLNVLRALAIATALPSMLGLKQGAIAKSRDAQVIDAAMLSFYEKTPWNTTEWTSGDFVTLQPAYRTDRRWNFDRRLDELIDWERKYRNAGALALLKTVRASTKGTGVGSNEAILPLAKLNLGDHIVITQKTKDVYRSSRSNPPTVVNRKGQAGTIRVSGRIEPPSYSADARYALIDMTWVPWSEHSADITFVLEGNRSGWKVVHVVTVIYP